MAPPRKADPSRPYDVPAPLAGGIAAVVAAVVLPMSLRGPAWPAGLPPLAHDPAAILAQHRAALRRTAPAASPAVLSAWRALNQSLLRREPAASAAAQRYFSTLVARATLHDRDAQSALRARACDVLGAARPAAEPDRYGVVALATRHRLLGVHATPSVDAAQRLAWCALRWERLALPTPDSGPVEPLTDTLLRVPPPVQRGFVRWALSARCAALVGMDGRAVSLDDPRRCAAYRRELLPVAARMQPGWPAERARAHTEMLLGLGLQQAARAPATQGADGFARSTALDEARRALQTAADAYGAELRTAPSHPTERLALGALRALADE